MVRAMIAMCRITDFVVISRLIGLATSGVTAECLVPANRMPLESRRHPRSRMDTSGEWRMKGPRQPAGKTSRVSPDLGTPFGTPASASRKELQGRARPLRVGPTKRILDPAVVQV